MMGRHKDFCRLIQSHVDESFFHNQMIDEKVSTIKNDSIVISKKAYSDSLELFHNHLLVSFLPKKGSFACLNQIREHLGKIIKQGFLLMPLGKRVFSIKFTSSVEKDHFLDLKSVCLELGRFSFEPWINDFNPESYLRSHANVWIRLHNLGIEYWSPLLLYHIAGAIGLPIMVDKSTAFMIFGQYARILVNIDLCQPLSHSLTIVKEGFDDVLIKVSYENLPKNCKSGVQLNRVQPVFDLAGSVLRSSSRSFRDFLMHSDSKAHPAPPGASLDKDVQFLNPDQLVDEVHKLKLKKSNGWNSVSWPRGQWLHCRKHKEASNAQHFAVSAKDQFSKGKVPKQGSKACKGTNDQFFLRTSNCFSALAVEGVASHSKDLSLASKTVDQSIYEVQHSGVVMPPSMPDLIKEQLSVEGPADHYLDVDVVLPVDDADAVDGVTSFSVVGATNCVDDQAMDAPAGANSVLIVDVSGRIHQPVPVLQQLELQPVLPKAPLLKWQQFKKVWLWEYNSKISSVLKIYIQWLSDHIGDNG